MDAFDWLPQCGDLRRQPRQQDDAQAGGSGFGNAGLRLLNDEDDDGSDAADPYDVEAARGAVSKNTRSAAGGDSVDGAKIANTQDKGRGKGGRVKKSTK